VTFVEPTTFATSYERLRSRALEGGAEGGHFGLVILLREGVAAWMGHAATQPPTVTRVPAKDACTAVPPIPDALRADVAIVLANMVMTRPSLEERCA
jgi:hypothetical protein